MRSIVGVGITPPKVLGTAKPASSVMISSTLGAPFGGTTRGAHQGFDCSASSLITPPNFGSGGAFRRSWSSHRENLAYQWSLEPPPDHKLQAASRSCRGKVCI